MKNPRVKAYDAVNQPPHYAQGKVACIDAIEAAIANKPPVEAFLVGQVVKYIWRYEAKGGTEDIKKAQWYLSRLLATVEGVEE